MGIPLQSIAGRHAADRQRALAAELALEQQSARAYLAHRLRLAGLVVFADCIGQREEVEPAIAVNCRVESCLQDRATVYALLDETGWSKDPSRFARHNGYGDFVPLQHPTTRAQCWLIVKVPAPSLPQWEAA